MTVNTDQIKKTVADLLRLAENDAAAEGEVENAIRFARRLMDAHHLSEEECRLDPHAAAAQKEIMGEQTIYGSVRTLAFWEQTLASFVELLVGSVGVYRTSKQIVRQNNIIQFDEAGEPQVKCGLVFYGPVEDINLACDLFDSLHQTIATVARLKYGGALRGDGRNYCEGFVVGLNTKLKEVKRQDLIQQESRALIVRSTEIAKATKERAKLWLQENKDWKLRKSQKRQAGSAYNANAFQDGITDGKNINPKVNRKAKITGSSSQRRIS
jgi:hypothetical protein